MIIDYVELLYILFRLVFFFRNNFINFLFNFSDPYYIQFCHVMCFSFLCELNFFFSLVSSCILHTMTCTNLEALYIYIYIFTNRKWFGRAQCVNA